MKLACSASLFLSMFFLVGCATMAPGGSTEMPPRITKIAITSNDKTAIYGAANAISKKGYSTVNLQTFDRPDSSSYYQIFAASQSAGADAVLIVDIYDKGYYQYQQYRTYYAKATASLVDVQSGKTLWSKDNVDRTPFIVALLKLPFSLLFLPLSSPNPSETAMGASYSLAGSLPPRSY